MRGDGGLNWDEDGCVRKMSGRRAGCCDPGSPTATDDPGLVSSEGEVDTAPTQPAFPGREQLRRRWAGRYAWIRSWGPSGFGDFHIVHPCRDKSFRKAVSAVMDNLVTDSGTIEQLERND